MRFIPLLAVVGALGCGDSSTAPLATTHATIPSHGAGTPDASAGDYPRGVNDGVPGTPPAPPAVDAAAPVPPLVAPDDTWTWLTIPGTECANGSVTGVGVNLSHKSEDILIFLQGGGACWDAASCWGPISTAFYMSSGYGKSEFDGDVQRTALLPLQKDQATNPFKDMSIVYLPYCTGDVHAGDRIARYDYAGTTHVTHHVGGRNFGVVLDRIKATFPSPKHVWVAGDSAGGFGAALNFGRVQDAFTFARIGVLDDSGQPVQPSPERWKQWKDAWGLKAPDECPQCEDDISEYVSYYRVKYPDNRFGLVSYRNDSIISTFMGLSSADFATELDALAARVDRSWPYAKYFLITGISHVGLLGASPELVSWMHDLVTWDPAWSSVRK